MAFLWRPWMSSSDTSEEADEVTSAPASSTDTSVVRVMDSIEALGGSVVSRVVDFIEPLGGSVVSRVMDSIEPLGGSDVSRVMDSIEPLGGSVVSRVMDSIEPLGGSVVSRVMDSIEPLGGSVVSRVMDSIEPLGGSVVSRVMDSIEPLGGSDVSRVMDSIEPLGGSDVSRVMDSIEPLGGSVVSRVMDSIEPLGGSVVSRVMDSIEPLGGSVVSRVMDSIERHGGSVVSPVMDSLEPLANNHLVVGSRVLSAVILGDLFFKSLHNNIVGDESDEEEMEEEAALISLMTKELEERIHGPRIKPLRLDDYVERIVPSYKPETFQSHFRMMPACAEEIENKLSPILARQGPIGRLRIPPRKQILSVIWLLATPDSYRSIGEMFGLSKGTLHHCFRRVVYALCATAKNEIFWPQDHQKPEIVRKFNRIAGMPNVIGAIDGCHIEIDAPTEDPAAYRTGKKQYSMQLQAVCTSDLILTDVFAGYPGSVHDARVLKNSPLYRDVDQLFSGPEYIVGDKAYPVRTWCIPPYKNYGNLTEAESMFNKKLSATRQVIERCFSLLKGRFRRLKHLCMYRTDEIALVIMACSVLHNICLRGLHDEPGHIEQYIQEGREQQPISHRNDHIDEGNDERSAEGHNKRDRLRDSLTQ